LTTDLVKRGGKRVTRNPTGNPREQVARGSESERAFQPSLGKNKPTTRVEGLAQNGKG
jgi:hypothetical protein